jgi:PST family polysaccharide transporter
MNNPNQSVAKWVSGAAIWSYAGVFFDRAMRFVVFIMVARLVSPTQFGLVILSLLIVELLQAFLDAGLSTALVQRSAVSKEQFDTAFIITMAVSALISAVLLFGAQSLTTLGHDHTAAEYLRALAIAPLISGAGAVQVAIIQRNIGFKSLAWRTAASSLASSIAAIVLALAGFGAWALIGRTLLAAISGTAIAWLSTTYRPSLHFNLRSVRTVVPAALRLWGANVANQINGKGFDFLAAAFLGAAALGALRIAGQTIMLLIDLAVSPMIGVGYAILSRCQHDQKLFEETLDVIARLAALLIFPAFAGLLVTGDLVLPLMFGSRWEPAAAIVPLMCVVAPAIYWYLIVSIALFARGRNDRMLQWALIEAVLTFSFGIVGARYALVGLATAGVLRLYVMAPLGWLWLHRDISVNPRLLVIAAVPSAISSAAMAAVVAAARSWLTSALSPVMLIVSLVVVGVVTYTILLPFFARRLLSQLLQQDIQEEGPTSTRLTARIITWISRSRSPQLRSRANNRNSDG